MKSKKAIIQTVWKEYNKAEAFLDSIPYEINCAFFDNPAMTSYGLIRDRLMEFIFPKDELEWVDWLFYEWNHNPELTIQIDGVEYRFNSFHEGLDKLFELGLIKEVE